MGTYVAPIGKILRENFNSLESKYHMLNSMANVLQFGLVVTIYIYIYIYIFFFPVQEIAYNWCVLLPHGSKFRGKFLIHWSQNPIAIS